MQARPHIPQLLVFVFKLAQVIPHRVSPAAQPLEHVPPEQFGVPPEQALPHIPQCVALDRSCSQPFAALPSQFPRPALQVPRRHIPPTQLADACVKEHRLPQAPQLFVSELVSMQVPPHSAPLEHRHAPAAQL